MAAGGAEGGSGPGAAMGDCAEIKSQFRTREGFYKLLPGDGAARRSGPASAQTPVPPQPPQPPPGPASATGPGAAGPASSPPPAGPGPGPALPAVRLSLVRLGEPDSAGAGEPPATPAGLGSGGDRVCFNLGRELYFYPGCCRRGSQRSIDLNKPIDKRIYKGTQPTCHDFNQFTAATETISLLVGFSAGQVQYLDLIKKDTSKLFNEERLIDKTKVTYLKWLPESESLFLASHASGHLYLYNVSHPCASAPPQYSLLKQGEGFSVYAAKSKAPRNPLAKWAVGEGPLNEFAFSPDGRHLACVSQDGCLRVFHFDSMLLRGLMKSYFGGLLCVCWSPDGRYVVTGGEDDLVTVWSFTEGRVVARGHGHKSWVNAVAFDPYTTRAEEAATAAGADGERSGEEEEEEPEAAGTGSAGGAPLSPLPKAGSITYRFGSAGQDTQFCLWDLTEDVLYPHPPLARTRTLPGTPGTTPPAASSSRGGEPGPGPLPRSLSRSNSLPHPAGGGKAGGPGVAAEPGTPFSIGRFATLTLQERRDRGAEKEHKRYHSLGNISRGGSGGSSSGGEKPSGPVPRSRLDPAKVLGTALCPRIHEVPLLEPLVCKKIAQERLTVLLFLEDCIITACQEGLICTWARPGKAFTDEETEAQTGEGSWPRSPSKSVVEAVRFPQRRSAGLLPAQRLPPLFIAGKARAQGGNGPASHTTGDPHQRLEQDPLGKKSLPPAARALIKVLSGCFLNCQNCPEPSFPGPAQLGLLGPCLLVSQAWPFHSGELSTLERRAQIPLGSRSRMECVFPRHPPPPEMFLFLIPAWAGMWLPGQGPRSYFGVSFARGGLGSTTFLPQALSSRSPLFRL
ncbi:dystrophia myotonica WD repeat-containing protein isoform X1 [Hylobates moloch]|uniref:dystrophia myotonica WD repeat-containing protein isoform X1 n=1 Tax=Hylobates moloch TaxID=81572 RepID=UPI002674D220|nr:dystrophia myotonica WD repeat-containing protein isoform X1 [Hylobates moloch]